MKTIHAKEVIRQFYEHYDGDVYVSISGGKHSVVLLDLVRSVYPDVVAVFSDTGMEYDDIRNFVLKTDNLVVVKPSMNFKQVIEKYGYPVLSKKISMGLDRYRKTKSELQRELRKFGGINPTSGKPQQASIPKKYHHLCDLDVKFSEKCCDILKKAPLKRFEKETGKHPFIGVLCAESSERTLKYLRTGCNAFDQKNPQSMPMSIFTDDDTWEHILERGLPYSSIYDKGETSTGCKYCMFGIQYDPTPNRFERMAIHHPRDFDYCMNKLNLKEVLPLLGVHI